MATANDISDDGFASLFGNARSGRTSEAWAALGITVRVNHTQVRAWADALPDDAGRDTPLPELLVGLLLPDIPGAQTPFFIDHKVLDEASRTTQYRLCAGVHIDDLAALIEHADELYLARTGGGSRQLSGRDLHGQLLRQAVLEVFTAATSTPPPDSTGVMYATCGYDDILVFANQERTVLYGAER